MPGQSVSIPELRLCKALSKHLGGHGSMEVQVTSLHPDTAVSETNQYIHLSTETHIMHYTCKQVHMSYLCITTRTHAQNTLARVLCTLRPSIVLCMICVHTYKTHAHHVHLCIPHIRIQHITEVCIQYTNMYIQVCHISHTRHIYTTHSHTHTCVHRLYCTHYT